MRSPDARLIYSASESDANVLWATRFFAPDPFIFIQKRKKKYVVMTDLELDRARAQATVDVVLPYSDYLRKLRTKTNPFPTPVEVMAGVLQDLKIHNVLVPSAFPIGVGDQLRAMNIQVVVQPDPFWTEREIKTAEEVRWIRDSLRAAEAGMEAGIETIRRTEIGRDNYLYLDGARFTSERLRQTINTQIMSLGYVPSHTIVASGDQCVDPHNEGSGPIRAHSSIIMDIFPRSQKTGFFGDITRTVVRGRASERLKEMFHCVAQGQDIGFRRVRNGANSYDIHFEILEFFKRSGFPTGPLNGHMQGFFHGTGHGLGLDIHEAPGFGPRSTSTLRSGHVVTVEPGLYYQGTGGVRLEDVVLVTDRGCHNLVKIPKFLEV